MTFEIVAHRGATTDYPENTLPAFQRAIELGADIIEMDVRLTKDHVPVIYHWFYLQEKTTLSGAIFNYTYRALQAATVLDHNNQPVSGCYIPTLYQVLNTFGGKIGFEIEIHGPEINAPAMIGGVLSGFGNLWKDITVTSYEPELLMEIKRLYPGLTVDLLIHRSKSWMERDVAEYIALNKAQLTHARAVHMHLSQLSPEIIAHFRHHGIDVYTWEINDEESLCACVELGIKRIATDDIRTAVKFRESQR
ncbi:MAG: glycerophosphodiester phosphodiesterase family protein [Phototrophicales bacterium]